MIAYERLKGQMAIRIGYDVAGWNLRPPLDPNPLGLPFLDHDLLDKGITGDLPTVSLILSEKELGQGLHPLVFDVIKVPLYGPHNGTCAVKDGSAFTAAEAEDVF